MNNNVGFWGREGKILIINVNVSTVIHHVKNLWFQLSISY